MKRTVESLTPPENKQVMWLDVSGKVKQLKTYINGEWVIVNDDTENNKEIVKTVLESIDKDFESYIKKEDADSKYVQQEVLDRDYVKSEYATKTYATIKELNNLSTSLDSDYVKKAYADSNYVIKSTLDGYITKSYAESTYAKITSLSDYIKSVDVENNYVSKTDTSYVKTDTLDNYVTIETANSTYATQTALAGKVAQETYDTKMTAIDSKLETLENKTIDVDAELKDSVNPVQNRAVNAAVLNLNTEIGKKADTTALNSAVGRITALENNGATGVTVTESGEGNGIASIKNVGKNIIATKATFVTSLTGYVTTDTLNTELAKKSNVDHNHDTKYAAKEHTHPEYAQSSTLNDYVTKTALDGKNFLTATSLNGYVNEVQPDGTQSGNGIANITKDGKVLKVTKSTFLTEHQSLADYATKTWVGEQGFTTGTIPTNVSQLTNDSGFLTQQSLNGYWNQLYVDEREGNGIAEIWVDIHNKSELCVSKRRFITPETLGTSIDDYASSKGYLTENNLNEKLKETVTIKLVSDKSASDTNLNGATVTVKSGNTTVSTQTWQGTPINVKVPCDKEVTIEAATVNMYVKPKALKYVPSPLYNREVTFTYKALETGTFIIDKNDNLYESPTDCEEAGLPKTDMVGVLLVTNNVAIVIAPKIIYNLIWSNKGNLIEGCATFPNYLDALKDFAGAANTAAIIGADSNSYIAARLCSNYVFKNGKKGYLMSVGEAKEIAENFEWLGPKLTYINDIDAPSESDKYWTSTQMNANSAWGFSMNRTTPSEVNKSVQTNAFAIYSLYD